MRRCTAVMTLRSRCSVLAESVHKRNAGTNVNRRTIRFRARFKVLYSRQYLQ
jgi:hypothetical protein